MSGGSEFHAAGPACEKERSPNLVRSHGITYLLLEADRWQLAIISIIEMMSFQSASKNT